jgi:hypothetical protein
MWRYVYDLSPYQLGMSMTCLRTNWGCLWPVSVPTTDVYDLFPYQLQTCLWPVSVPTTDMSMICLRTSYRYIYGLSPTNYRYVYDLSPYQLPIRLWPVSVPTPDMSTISPLQLQIGLWPVSLPTPDMSTTVSVPTTDLCMTCLRNSHRYVPDLFPYQPPHALLQWPTTHCQNPPKQYLRTSALLLLHHLSNSCILF